MDATIVPEVQKHYPVLLKEIISIISPQYGGTFIDCTFGQGGFSKQILEFKNTNVIALDREIESKKDANQFKENFEDRFIFKNIKFSQLNNLKLKNENIKILILEGLTDPHNVGACLRSAAGADIDAVIVPKNRSCHLTPTVRKISCGASELIPFVVVTNIVRTINKLQDCGVRVYGSDLQANASHDEVKYSKKFALVIGSEDKGIRRLTRENCDELIKINMSQKMDSLNASVSTGILLFEISRQNKIN